MKNVSLVKCDNYDENTVYEAVKKSIDLIGGIKKYVKEGDRVFLKVNLLGRYKISSAVTTNPSVVKAVVTLVNDAGGTAIIGDSPGGPFNERMLKSIYNVTGMSKAAEDTGAGLNYNTEEITVKIPDGKMIKSATFVKAVIDADVIIDMPKLKTHGLTTYTGAVKNLFGTIPGLVKAGYHLSMPNVYDFSDMLIDLNEYLKPSLTVMDAVVGMEGSGPSAGVPRKIGAVLASDDTYSLDSIAVKIIGLDVKDAPTIKAALQRGLGDINDVDLKGDSLDEIQLKYNIPIIKSINLNDRVPRFIRKYIDKFVKPRPSFDGNICKACGICVSNCPPKALVLKADVPHVDLDKCIRCFCCQELCPQKAVKIKKSLISKLMYR